MDRDTAETPAADTEPTQVESRPDAQTAATEARAAEGSDADLAQAEGSPDAPSAVPSPADTQSPATGTADTQAPTADSPESHQAAAGTSAGTIAGAETVDADALTAEGQAATPPGPVAPDAEAPAAGSEAPPEAAPEEKRDPKVDRAAQRCATLIANGALDAVDKLATPYVGEAGWRQLQDSWRRENCAMVAMVARQALQSPAKLHDAAGKFAAQVWTWLGRPWVEQMMIREVVKRLPILGEGQVRPVARAIQLAGIRLCQATDHDLAHCPVFVDLVEHEGERRPKQLLEAGTKGWDALARLR